MFANGRFSVNWGQKFGSVFCLYGIMVLMLPDLAQARNINWQSLNLTQQQESQIQKLETNWEKTHQEVNTQIERDKAELKQLLPTGENERIRFLQIRIMNNKMHLMKESMDTFLKKRDMLTPSQRVQLQQMIPAAAGSGNSGL